MSFPASARVAGRAVPAALLLLGTVAVPAADAQARARAARPVAIDELTIADIHTGLRAGRFTCRGLVDAYLARIAAHDTVGAALNAIVTVHPRARAIADSLDAARRRAPGAVGTLHCVPVIVKDNFETYDLPTTAGSLALRGFVPAMDATQVARVRAAGAVILAKANMAEFAFTPYETVSSILPGYTRNPYATERVTAGSSGGTAAAVAASYGAVGLGTDTGNSIRGPSAHQALVGLRSTMGLTSRAGVVPLFLASDVAGPMTRTVADAAAMLQVIAGPDTADPVTAAAVGRAIPDYRAALRRDGLRGARIGVLVQAYQRPTTDPEIEQVFRRALADLGAAGATVVDSIVIPDLDERLRGGTGCNTFRADLEAWMTRHGDRLPVRSLAELVRSNRYHPTIRPRLDAAAAESLPPSANPACAARDAFRAWLRTAVDSAMGAHGLDALAYPTWSNPPRRIGDLNTPHGDNSQLFSPGTGYPAITVPMGWTRGGRLPAGLQLLGRAWGEPTLLRLAYAYEQRTRHRRPPTLDAAR